jgi:YspA, cpYpsA-related SLOG family
MRIVVTGDSLWACHQLAVTILRRLVARFGPDIVIVHGGDPGVDESFAMACKGLGITVEARLSDWYRAGSPPGPKRNQAMIESGADLCIALHRSITTSSRTKDCTRKAVAAGIPTVLIEDERAIPRRIEAGDERLV